MSTRAAALKDEGNKLFAQKDFGAAYIKYTDAIALDEKNAVLWANRSACQLSLKNTWMPVVMPLAISFDPTYYKAYARLATAQDALEEYMLSCQSWKNALDAMPAKLTTETQRVQREEYKKNLKLSQTRREIKAKLQFAGSGARRYTDNDRGHPWDIACDMVSDLREKKIFKSSAWVVDGAYKLFQEGVRRMHTARPTLNEKGEKGCCRVGCKCLEGEEGALMLITNGILREPRVWHLIDVDAWTDAYNMCGTFERQRHQPWIGLGPDSVKRDVPGRLAENGWDNVRPAIDLTIRFWLIRDKLDTKHKSRVEYATQVLNVIEWGRDQYSDIPLEVKGEIFGRDFLRAVRSLLLDALLEAFALSQKQRNDEAEYLVPLLRHADIILKDLETDSRPSALSGTDEERDPGYYLSFYDYPKGNALAAKAFFYSSVAQRRDAKQAERSRNNVKATELYLQAAECYPMDDEKYEFYLNCAIQHGMQIPGLKAKDALEITTKIKKSYPLASKLWRAHPMRVNPEMKSSYERVLKMDKDVRDMLAAGGDPNGRLAKNGPDMDAMMAALGKSKQPRSRRRR